MKLTRAMLDEAAGRGLLDEGQAGRLWQFLVEREQHTPGFKPAHILYYLGGLIAIGAMSLFMTLGWESFGGTGLLFISLCYMAAALGAVEWLRVRGLVLPAGVLAAFAVALVPLAVYGLQHMLGLWAGGEAGSSYRNYHYYVDWRWIFMELATLAAGAVVLWRYRMPFTVMPLAVTLWYMSMDVAEMLLGHYGLFSREGKIISAVFGVGMTLVALWIDLRNRSSKDYAFWLYIWGVLAFWGALSSMDSGSEFGKLVYCLINVVMIGLGAALSRRVFAVFGGFGLAGYLGHLSYTVFRDSLLFPVALTAIGIAIIAAGVFWQRREARIGASLRQLLPGPVRLLVERRAA
ncbi:MULTISPECIES: hypothetical protein [unclassified Duganella]|uniref:hypothetical protein n=1 Tax=unclassified Duganella TaxID=2636909 RepID=UPI0007010024|nr:MULTISPECIES: hypothetical protein [unclassified Duganella]KQV54513.1 hypothetical protein ASD07_08325 [Duganella sp. Root336D2]KRC03638.1 hypothetical protein ASE26_02050 [Duganella sp. Root198D2]